MQNQRPLLIWMILLLLGTTACIRQSAQPPATSAPAPPPANGTSAQAPATDASEPPPVDAEPADARGPDLDGDGQADRVEGTLESWTDQPIRFFRHDGTLLGEFHGSPQHRAAPMELAGHPGTLFLYQRGTPDGPFEVTMLAGVHDFYAPGRLMVQPVYGWAFKADYTRGTALEVGEDGLITVTLDLGDPARHQRVQRFRFVPGDKERWPGVTLAAEEYRPVGPELAYPSTPDGVVQAAFVARWLGLDDELPRYFSDPEEAAHFGADPRISRPDYEPGTVTLGSVTPPAEPESMPAVSPGEPPEAGVPAEYLAMWGGYEWADSVWGEVTFSRDAQGRWLIAKLAITGRAGVAH